MKKHKNYLHKRVLALVLAMMICVGMVPFTASASDAEPEAPEAGLVREYTIDEIVTLADEDGEDVEEAAGDEDTAESDEVSTEDAVGLEDEGFKAVPTVAPSDAPLAAEETEDVPRPTQDPETIDVITGNVVEDNPELTKSPEPTPETTDEPIATPATNPNWNVFYDKESDTYKVTYVIDEDAEGDQTIDLTIALGFLHAYEAAAQAPSVPGMPEGYEEANKAFAEAASKDPSFSEVENALAYLKDKGLNPEDEYTKSYAQYMVDSADYKQACKDWNEWVSTGDPRGHVGFFGDLDTFLHYGCGFPGGANYGPTAPTYKLDPNSKEGKDYQEALDEYRKQSEAATIQPGDIRKFQFNIVSKSGHTYTYKNGSFKLMTPDTTDKNGGHSGVFGYDGQELSDEYCRDIVIAISHKAKPIEELLKAAGVWDDYEMKGNQATLTGYNKTCFAKYLSQHYNVSTEGKTEAEILEEGIEKYLLSYYKDENGNPYSNLTELVKNDSGAYQELVAKGLYSQLGLDISKNDNLYAAAVYTIDAKEAMYNSFYNDLMSFLYTDSEEGYKAFYDALNKLPNGASGKDSWSAGGFNHVLADYEKSSEVWKETNTFFRTLFASLTAGGISAKNAEEFVSFVMAVNMDGFLGGNGWQNTAWGWYNSIQLEQRDEMLILNKKDGNGDIIESSETGFQIWYVDHVTDQETGETKNVNMYCMYDEEKGAYTFVPDVSSITTEKGTLTIEKALMKDILYYLQEIAPPEGFEQDTTIYIICDPTLHDVERALTEIATDKGVASKYLGSLGEGLTINFVNVETPVIPEEPTPTPVPTPPTTPDPSDPPPEEPDEPVDEPPTPLVPTPEEPEEPEEPVEDPEVPLVPSEPEEPIDDPEVPLADVPKTGDISGIWFVLTMFAACGLAVVAYTGKRRES